MNVDRHNLSSCHEDDDYADVHFTAHGPRHRTSSAPDRARAKRKSFHKRHTPCPVRGMAHRRNHRIDW